MILHTPELTFHENRNFVYTISAVTQKLFVYLSATFFLNKIPLAGIQTYEKVQLSKNKYFFQNKSF